MRIASAIHNGFLGLLVMGMFASAPLGADDAKPAQDEILLIHDLRYREGPLNNWTLDLAMPKGEAGKPRPAIVVIHGGGWIQGDKSSFSRPQNLPPGNILDFARQGYVAATINYRLSDEAIFPAALHDCKNAVRYLRAHAAQYGIDPERIGAWGNSAGGHLALMLGLVDASAKLEGDGPYLEQSSLVQAVVSDSGPIDLLHQYEHDQVRSVIGKFLGGPPEGERIADYKLASPINFISSKTPPILLIYGVADEQVGVETADQFVVALNKAGRQDVSYIRLAEVGHCPYSLKGVDLVPPVVNDFFARTLRLREPKAP